MIQISIITLTLGFKWKKWKFPSQVPADSTEPKDVAAPTVQNRICFAEPSHSIELIGVNNFIAKTEI